MRGYYGMWLVESEKHNGKMMEWAENTLRDYF